MKDGQLKLEKKNKLYYFRQNNLLILTHEQINQNIKTC